MSRFSDCKVYVGDLGSQASKVDLEDAFGYYGPLRNVWVARNPPGFAFIEFEDARDAEDAVKGLDGRTVCGRRVRVEQSNGANGRGRRDRGPPRRRFNPDDRCYECGDRGHYARDCRRGGGGGGGGGRRSRRSRSYSRSPRRRTRSRSLSRPGKSRSRSPIKSRSKSPVRRSRSRSSRSRSRVSDKQNGRN